MLDTRIVKLLNIYSKIRVKAKTSEMIILERKYNVVFGETKYLFEKLFVLGEANYEAEAEALLRDIEQKEQILIAILCELIDTLK